MCRDIFQRNGLDKSTPVTIIWLSDFTNVSNMARTYLRCAIAGRVCKVVVFWSTDEKSDLHKIINTKFITTDIAILVYYYQM